MTNYKCAILVIIFILLILVASYFNSRNRSVDNLRSADDYIKNVSDYR